MSVRTRFRRFYECDTEAERSLEWGIDSIIHCLDTSKYYKVFGGTYEEIADEDVVFNIPIQITKLAISGVPDGNKYLRDDGSWTTPPGGGDVVGPGSAVNNNFAAFNLTTGKLIKDSGYSASSFWSSLTGATLTGINTVTVFQGSGLNFNGTWTATANNQANINFGGNITSRNTNGDSIYGYLFDPIINANAGAPTSLNAAGVRIAPTFVGSFSGVRASLEVWANNGSMLALTQNGYGTFYFATGAILSGDTGDLEITGPTNFGFSMLLNGSRRFTINKDGNVAIGAGGIGTASTRLDVRGVAAGNILVGKDSAGVDRFIFTDGGTNTFYSEQTTPLIIRNAANTYALSFQTQSSNPVITQTGGNSFDFAHLSWIRTIINTLPYFNVLSGGHVTVDSLSTTAPVSAATQISSVSFNLKNMIWNGTDADSGYYTFQNVVSTSVNSDSELILKYQTEPNYYAAKPTTFVTNLFKVNRTGAFFLSTTPANDDALTNIIVRDATTGEFKYRNSNTIGGGSLQGSWSFDTATGSADPGNKKMRFNNATLASVTAIYFNDTTNEGTDASTIISYLTTGNRIYVQQRSDAGKAVLFQVSGTPTDNTGWWTVPVTVVNSSTLMDNNANTGVVLSLTVAGGGGGGYTNLTEFVAQTAWRLFHSNSLGDVVEFALGADGTYLKSTGTSSAPVWATGEVCNEVPSGTINGSNTVFTTAGTFATGKTKVYLNGLRQKIGGGNDYTETAANQITFTNAPQTGDTIVMDYI